ncbi:laccase-15-like [Phragmites australis]|uniref:laccase-15-like n=1 Tax=Phragmites australis TaxID=29695 RepID=UPI002D7A3C1B|nr:laccase-15-like [Phragmites australis]
MKSRSLPAASAAVAVVFFLSATALPAATAIVEHTFVVSQVNMTHLCKETLVTVVNGQLPGPTIEVTEGDSLAVHVVNKSPYNITIHWHGVRQRLNCWADGVPMITQCPILPNHNFTYRFEVAGQEGTLWWHAHVSCLRGTLHGAIIIRPRHGADLYPFPKPHREIPIIMGDWWEMDLAQLDRDFMNGSVFDHPNASTINGKLGDLFNCSGAVEDGYVLDVEPGKTYLLRVINAALFSEYYLKIAGHKFTVVAADANYVNPYTTDVVVVAPGETVDALVVADAPPGRYYMVAQPSETPPPDPPIQVFVTRGMVRYKYAHDSGNGGATLSSGRSEEEEEGAPPSDDVPVAPEMPDKYDTMTSFYFHGNLTSLHQPCRPLVPAQVDERLFIALGMGTVCRRGQSCKRSGSDESIQVATMNNVSFQLPAAVAAPLLEAQYYNHNNTAGGGVELYTLPDRPPRAFNFTDRAMINWGPEEAPLEPTKKATVARRFRHGATVEVVFQSTSLLQSDSNPMHLHGHDVFVLAQGLGNYDAARDVARYNLVDPPVRNTVRVPRLGWVAVRFVADNPGIWYMHCHYEFHLSMGMTALFIVQDGPTVDTSLPPPPVNFLTCDHDNSLIQDEFYLQTKESEVSHINGVRKLR